MNKILNFFSEVRQEASKITWLSRKEALTTTLMVVAVVAVFSMVFVVADYFIYHIVQFVVNLGV